MNKGRVAVERGIIQGENFHSLPRYEGMMQESISKITSKGQITLPAAVRRHLGLSTGDEVAFAITEDGTVQVRQVKYPTIASLAGAAGSLPEPRTWKEMRDLAYEERLRAKLARSDSSDE